MFDDIVPWWLRHSPDEQQGGFFTRLGRDGTRYADDKDIWMNGRAIWMFSHLYNRERPHGPWLEAAKLGVDFMLRHAFQPNGDLYFRLRRDGSPISTVLSKYTEVFGSIGLAEYSRAAQDAGVWDRALQMYDHLMPKLGRAENTPLLGYPVDAQFHLHADDMCRITVAWVYNQIRPDAHFEQALTESVDSIVHRHWKPDMKVMLENVGMDGSPLFELQEGRMFHPGHAIESAWMLMEIARQRHDESLLATAIDITLASLEHGWDRSLAVCDTSPTTIGRRSITSRQTANSGGPTARPFTPRSWVGHTRVATISLHGMRRSTTTHSGPFPTRSSVNGSGISIVRGHQSGPRKPMAGRGSFTCRACCFAVINCWSRR